MQIFSQFVTKVQAVFLALALLSSGIAPARVCAEEAQAPQAPAAEASRLQEILIKAETITLKTDKPADYKVFKMAAPPRLVIELTGTENAWKKKSATLSNNAYYKRVRAGQFQNEPVKIVRVVVDLKSDVDYEDRAEGSSIVVAARKAEAEEAAAPTSMPMTAAPTPSEWTKPEASKNTMQTASETPRTEASEPAAPAKKSSPESTQATSSDPSSLFGRQLVTLDFYDIDIKDLFKILGEKSGVNVVYGNDISGTVSIQLRDVPFKDAVDTILALKNLKMVVLGKNILQVMSAPEFDDYRTRAITATKVFPINYAQASNVSTQLTTIMATLGGKGKTMVDDRTNSLIVTDTPDGIDVVAKLIADLDKPTPQVMIEAKIVQVALNKSLDLGITWGAAYSDQSGGQMFSIGAAQASKSASDATAATPGSGSVGLMTRTALNPAGGTDLEATGAGFNPATGLGLSFGFVKDAVRLNAALSALQQKSKAKVLSNPKVATLNNQAAVIKSQTSEPYITQQVSFSQGQSVQPAVTAPQKRQSEHDGRCSEDHMVPGAGLGPTGQPEHQLTQLVFVGQQQGEGDPGRAHV
jgi:type IV pilus assembly protein PilQ